MSHPVTRLMASLRGIQGPRVIPRVTAPLEEPPAGSWSPQEPPEWWKREQRQAELEKDWPRPSKWKLWWSDYNVPVVLIFVLLVLVAILIVATRYGGPEWLK